MNRKDMKIGVRYIGVKNKAEPKSYFLYIIEGEKVYIERKVIFLVIFLRKS